MNIPVIIPVFNQLSYLKNFVNWWAWYYPENDIYIVDNASTYEPLLDYYEQVAYENKKIHIVLCSENKCAENLADVIKERIEGLYDYYVVSDPDVMIHPSTPPDFLDVFKNCLDVHNFHRVGFGLITDDLPEWLHKREEIIYNESQLMHDPYELKYNDKIYTGFKAPLDTTFSMFKSSHGWYAPMNGVDWGNCLRLFKAFHLTWYLSDDVNPEMENYFTTAKYRDLGPVSAGKNNSRPKKYTPE